MTKIVDDKTTDHSHHARNEVCDHEDFDCDCGEAEQEALDYELSLPRRHIDHRGTFKVRVGDFCVQPGGLQYFGQGDLEGDHVLVPLTDELTSSLKFGRFYEGKILVPTGKRHSLLASGWKYDVLCAHLPDFGGVTPNWKEFLTEQVIPLLQQGKTLLPYCYASHGRTGTFIGSLISLLEPETVDPVKAVRQRHCHHAVETLAQAKAIFALRNQDVPEALAKTFKR